MAASRRRRGGNRNAKPRPAGRGEAPAKLRRRRRWLGGLVLLLLVPVAAWLGLFVWGFFPDSPRDIPARRLKLQSRDRGAAAEALGALGLVESPRLVGAYLTLVAPFWPLAVREHWLPGGWSPRQLARALADRGQDSARVVLPEGQTTFDLAERLERAGICSSAGFLAAARDPELLAEFAVPGPSAEGYLFPESHELRIDERPDRVVRTFLREGARRHRALREKYPLEDEHRALGFGWAEVVSLASMVEKETANAAERPRIARVFLNRLLSPTGETGGRLESDPTAVYGCQVLGAEAPPACRTSAGLASPALLRDPSNPYGTYRRPGLPPGPIGNPGEAALIAVLRPSAGDELYFVADGSGNHSFSRTFAEHRAAVERLRAARRTAAPPM